MGLVKDYVIVGGGTSGWMTAAAFLHSNPFQDISITLIDKEQPDSVGVGEATLLGFQEFLIHECGFSQKEFLRELDTTFKGGILFDDWGKDGNRFWHPFYFIFADRNNPGTPMLDAWSNFQDDFDFNYFSGHYAPCIQNKIDQRHFQDGTIQIDCKKLVEFIRKKIGHRITYIESTVVEVNRDGSDITSLNLKNGQEIFGDIYFDCTGFKSLLKEERDLVDLSDRLYCDTAIAGHVPYWDRELEMHPYTRCTAVDHGWVWTIPLQSRMGSGLVFNRGITDVDEAKDYFVNYWSNRIDRDSLKVIDWTPYYDKTPWVGNVISIGLSSGFIEPLESTGLALMIEGIAGALEILKGRFYNKYHINWYNLLSQNNMEQCIDFVNMHYSVSSKDTKFWRYVRDTYKMSSLQEQYIDNLDSQSPSSMGGNQFFYCGANWLHWLVSLGYKIQPKEYIMHDKLHDIMEEEERLQLDGTLITHTKFVNEISK